MGTYAPASEESNNLRRDSAENVSQRNADGTAIGRDNGRTTIGTAAGDIGKSGLDAAARGLATMGVAEFKIADDGINKPLSPALEKELQKILRQHAGETPCERAIRGRAETDKWLYMPREEQRNEAVKKLDDQINSSLQPEDQKILAGLHKSIVHGRSGEVRDAIVALQRDPAKRDKIIAELNSNLESAGSVTGALVDGQGNVVIYSGQTAVVYEKNGKSTVRETRRRDDGSVVLGGEVIAGTDSWKAQSQIGEDTVHDITGKRPIFGNPSPASHEEPMRSFKLLNRGGSATPIECMLL
jgi:hypothetical protein